MLALTGDPKVLLYQNTVKTASSLKSDSECEGKTSLVVAGWSRRLAEDVRGRLAIAPREVTSDIMLFDGNIPGMMMHKLLFLWILLSSVFAATPKAVDPSGFTYTSTPKGDRLVKKPVAWAKSSTFADVTLIFDDSVQLQTLEGFGGAFTEASAYNYMKLSPTDRARVMELYFGKTGNKYNMGRIPMK
jgi:hypothetical protein